MGVSSLYGPAYPHVRVASQRLQIVVGQIKPRVVREVFEQGIQYMIGLHVLYGVESTGLGTLGSQLSVPDAVRLFAGSRSPSKQTPWDLSRQVTTSHAVKCRVRCLSVQVQDTARVWALLGSTIGAQQSHRSQSPQVHCHDQSRPLSNLGVSHM